MGTCGNLTLAAIYPRVGPWATPRASSMPPLGSSRLAGGIAARDDLARPYLPRRSPAWNGRFRWTPRPSGHVLDA
jgi:hypothetical protein